MNKTAGVKRNVALLLAVAFTGGLALSGCSWFGGTPKPGWVDGTSAEFSSAQYLLGEGQSSSKSAAEIGRAHV